MLLVIVIFGPFFFEALLYSHGGCFFLWFSYLKHGCMLGLGWLFLFMLEVVCLYIYYRFTHTKES